MNLGTISSNLTSGLIPSTGRGATVGQTNTTQNASMPGTDRAGMSRMGEIMKQLDGLQSSDPEKFKEVTAKIGDQLKELAKSQSGDSAQKLTELASKFTEASTSGSMSALKPSGPPPNGGPPPQRAAAYAQQQSSGANIGAQIDQIISNAITGSST